MIRYARWVCETPLLNHEVEPYLSSISILLPGGEPSGDRSLCRTAYGRAQPLKTGRLSLSFEEASGQAELFEALERVAPFPAPTSTRTGGPSGASRTALASSGGRTPTTCRTWCTGSTGRAHRPEQTSDRRRIDSSSSPSGHRP